MSKSLDLGCGDTPRNPFHADEVYGVDVRDGLAGRVRRADLVVDPIPFADASFDYVTAHDFIEHLPRVIYAPERRHPFVEVLNEVHRVLKPGGLFFSFTPAYPHVEAFRDPTHVNIITFDTFPMYFADPHPYAVFYGFKGAFESALNIWRGEHVVSVLRKIESPRLAKRAMPAGSRVSVVLPADDPCPALATTLASLLAQTHEDFEVVWIGAGAPNDPRVVSPHEARRAGSLPQALNAALPSMSGDYVVLARAGMRYPADWLAQQVQSARAHDADAVVVGVPGDATCTGREACERFGESEAVEHALWDLRLVRSIGFEEFSADAHRYSARRFLLASRRVARVEGSGDALPQATAASDAPYTELRLMQLYQEQGLPLPNVRACKARALALLAELQHDPKPGLHADAAGTRHAIERCKTRLSMVHVFDPHPRPTARQRLRTWKRALLHGVERLGVSAAHR